MRPKPVRYSLLGSPVNMKQRTLHSDLGPYFSGTQKRKFVFSSFIHQNARFLLASYKQMLSTKRTEVNTATDSTYTVCSIKTATYIIRLIFQLLLLNSPKFHVFFHKTYLWEHHPSAKNETLSCLIGRFQASKNSHFINPYYLHLSP